MRFLWAVKKPLESVAQYDRTAREYIARACGAELRKKITIQWKILIFSIDGALKPSVFLYLSCSQEKSIYVCGELKSDSNINSRSSLVFMSVYHLTN